MREEAETCWIGYLSNPYENKVQGVKLQQGGAWTGEFLTTHYSNTPKVKDLISLGEIVKLGINVGPLREGEGRYNAETDCEYMERDRKRSGYPTREFNVYDFCYDYGGYYRYLFDCASERWFVLAGARLFVPVPDLLRLPTVLTKTMMTCKPGTNPEGDNDEDEE